MINRFDGLITPRSARFTPVTAPIRSRASAASVIEGLGSCRAIGIGSLLEGIDQVERDPLRLPHDPVDRGEEDPEPPRFPQQDQGHVVAPCVSDDLAGHVRSTVPHDPAAERPGRLQGLAEPRLVRLRGLQVSLRLDREHGPLRLEPARHPVPGPDHLVRVRPGPDPDENPFRRRPRPRDRPGPHQPDHLPVRDPGDEPERELAERDQVRGAKKRSTARAAMSCT